MSKAANDFSSLVFFGDSLTDNGNLFALTGGTQPPSPPYFNGRFSNGPTYAELVPGLTGATALNFAFGGAEALTTPGDAPIQQITNLNAQIANYLASIPTGAADGTAAVLNIGNNDYLRIPPTATPLEVGATIQGVLGSIATAAQQLLGAGVDKIILFTLPSVAVTPLGATLPPAAVASAQAVIEAHNAGLRTIADGLAASGVNVEIVDIFRLANELAADRETFGFETTTARLIDNLADPDADPDSFAFFDSIHPTAAAHKVQAAFVEASLEADSVRLLDAGNDTVHGGFHDDLIFTGAGADRVLAGFGSDTVFSGTGNDIVLAGFGDDLIAGGGGDDTIFGELGSDLLAGNLGDDLLFGGLGDDALIAGAGSDTLFGGLGDDILVFSEVAGPGADSVFDGGLGRDTLRLSITAQTYQSAAFQAELDQFLDGYRAWSGFGSQTFASLDLRVSDVERLELSVEGETVLTAGRSVRIDKDLAALLQSADLWGLV